MDYTLQDIALGGAALTAVSSWLTQVLKKLIELRWGPKDPVHDPLVHVVGVVASVLCVEVATLATVSAAAFSPAWWQALMTGAGLGLGVKISAQGAYALLTSGKVDALPALATEVLQAFVPATPQGVSVPSVFTPTATGTFGTPVVTTSPPAPTLDAKALATLAETIAPNLAAAVVAALTPAAFTPPAPPAVVTPSPIVVPASVASGLAPVPVELPTSS